MAQVIRSYQDGDQVVLTEQLRHGGLAKEILAAQSSQTKQEAENILAEAAATLTQARHQAAALRQQAEQDVLVLQAEAQAKGFAEGYQHGMAEGQTLGQRMFDAEVERVRAVLASVQNERTNLLHNAEREVATLSLAISEKVIGKIGRENRDVILYTVNRALHELTITGPFLLRINPADAAHFSQTWHGVDRNGEPYVWKLVPDAEIEPGGCVLVCGLSTVDARLSTQFKAIVQGLSLTNYRLDNEADDAETDEARPETPSR